MKLDGDFEIYVEVVGWWQYNYRLQKIFNFKSKRLEKFIDKRYIIDYDWTIITTQHETIGGGEVDWKKLYSGEFTDG